MQTNTSTGFGVNVWWTLPEISVDARHAQTLLVKHGFEANDLKIPTRQIEVSRAAYSMQNRRGKENRRVTEKTQNDGTSVSYGILNREQTGAQVSFAQKTTVRLDKGNGEVTAEGDLAEIYKKTLAEYQGKITDADVRYFLRKVIRMCFGVAKRPTGGIYFVPSQFSGIIQQARDLVTEFNSGAHIYVEPIVDCVEARQNVWNSVQEDVEARLSETIESVKKIGSRVSAVQGKKEEIDEANELMQVYQRLLGEEAKYQDLAEKIDDAVKIVNEKIAEIQQNKAPAPVKAAKEPKTGTAIEVAVKVLSDSKKPISYRDIVAEVQKAGLYDFGTKSNPLTLFNGALLRALKTGDKRFVRVGRGVYQTV